MDKKKSRWRLLTSAAGLPWIQCGSCSLAVLLCSERLLWSSLNRYSTKRQPSWGRGRSCYWGLGNLCSSTCSASRPRRPRTAVTGRLVSLTADCSLCGLLTGRSPLALINGTSQRVIPSPAWFADIIAEIRENWFLPHPLRFTVD